jgi:error-prone DNA polymerase
MTVGYENPPIPWSELERKLSDRSRPGAHGGRPPDGDGGDSPAWSQHRAPYAPPAYEQPQRPDGPVVPYAELHAHSNFSFLDGASSPEDLVEEAVRLGLHALALTDHDGFYGAARLAETAASYDLTTVFGAELSMGLTGPQNGVPEHEAVILQVRPSRRCITGWRVGSSTEARHQAGGRRSVPTTLEGTLHRAAASDH